MKTLLKVQASIYGNGGQSSKLADQFVSQWLANNPSGRVVTRDLSAEPVPHLTQDRFAAFLAKPTERTPEQQAIVGYSDALIDELQKADAIVFAVPMYNFSVPSTVRAYFDHIARAGVTFRYTERGPEGMLKGKQVYVFLARGGVYNGEADTQTPYLRQFLGFIGLTDIKFVYAQGLAMGEEARDRGLAQARHAIEEFMEAASAAA
jgi:FMN-dependent NADH-azoreductase